MKSLRLSKSHNYLEGYYDSFTNYKSHLLTTILIVPTLALVTISRLGRIKSPNFLYGEKIPKKYTPYGKDIHPSFYWFGFPKETKSFVIICEDPDTPSGKIFTHWAVKNIPVNIKKIEEGQSIGEEIKNSWGFERYSGPKPPNGTHRYFFRIYDIKFENFSSKTLNGLKKDIEFNKIAEAEMIGIFG